MIYEMKIWPRNFFMDDITLIGTFHKVDISDSVNKGLNHLLH